MGRAPDMASVVCLSARFAFCFLPVVNRHPTATGKRPVQARLPGLSTPSKPKRGRVVAGANKASRAPAQRCHRPAAAHGLFALRFIRAATMTSPRNEGQGRASAPPRGLETRVRGTGGPTAQTLEPLARVLLLHRVH